MTALAPNIQKFSIKLKLNAEPQTAPAIFFKTFNTWIPDKSEIFIDVADYSHVTDGPLTVLIGHYADLVLDYTDNVMGFVYRQKRTTETSFEKTFTKSLSQLFYYTKLIEDDAALNSKITIDKTQLEISFNDRLLAPNTQAGYDALVKPITKACLTALGLASNPKITLTPAPFSTGDRLAVKILIK